MQVLDPGSDPVRKHISDWPYTSHYLQATLDPDLIAQHGRAILLRALNNGRLVCFVGSGVSMAYGRMGWGELVRAMDDQQRRRESGRHPMDAELSRWLRQLNLGARSDGDDLHSGRFPAAFQFLEQLAAARDLAGTGSRQAEAPESTTRTRARVELFDDRGHGYHLLDDLLTDLKKVGVVPKRALDAEKMVGIPRDASGLRRESIERAQTSDEPAWRDRFVLNAKTLRRAETMMRRLRADGLPLAATEYLDVLRAMLDPASERSKVSHGVPVTPPLLRFVSAALARFGEPFLSSVLGPVRSSRPADVRRRSSQLPPECDPLMLLAKNLGITRFITTNYDLDIERMLRDRGFTLDHRPGPQRAGVGFSGSRDALGTRARDGLFTVDRACDLIEFATQGTDHAFSVIHLHGRATFGDPMVVTDEDYLSLYLKRGEEAEMAEHAISLAFGANPLLFVGSGMSEDDILRPLRQFVSERTSRVDRQAVVLLPADGSLSKQIEEVIALYSRYGVHTMHFGIGLESGVEVRWLAAFRQLIRGCVDVLKVYRKFAESGAGDLKADITRVAMAFTLEHHLGFDRKGDEALDPAVARSIWIESEAPDRWPVVRLPKTIDKDLPIPLPDESGAVEMATLNALVDATFDIALSCAELNLADLWLGAKADESGFDIDARAARLVAEPWVRSDAEGHASGFRAVTAYLAMARGLPSALLGLAMCAKLRALELGLLHWRLERSRLPVARSASGPRETVIPVRPDEDGKGNLEPSQEDSAELLSRHPLALKASPWAELQVPKRSLRASSPANRVPHTDRFFSDAPSQTFQALLSAIRTHVRDGDRPPGAESTKAWERRVIVLYADRGAGKGHFFEALRTERRLGEFIEWSWPKALGHIKYAAFAYFNLSFSLEVVSAFDRVADLLTDQAGSVFLADQDADLLKEIKRTRVTLASNRVARLQRLMQLYASGGHPKRRVLIALSPFNILFDERGDPKNAELHRVVRAMLGEEAANAPIDFVLLCSGAPFPNSFRLPDPLRPELKQDRLDGWSAQTPRFRLEHLVPSGISGKGRRRLQDTVQRLRVNVLRKEDSAYSATKSEAGTHQAAPPPKAWFHVLREARTANTLAKYFPEVALSLALSPGVLATRGPVSAPTPDRLLRFADPSALSDMRDLILGGSDTYKKASAMVMDLPAALTETAAQMAELGRSMAITNRRAVSLFAKALRKPRNTDHQNTSAEKAGFDGDCRVIFRGLERSRYLATVACAAVAEIAWQDSPKGGVILQSHKVVHWWLSLLSQLSTNQANDKPDFLISHVLDHYKDLHEAQQPLPVGLVVGDGRLVVDGLSSSRMKSTSLRQVLRGPLGWSLQQRLLWHLAVIGHPVEADVLSLAPEVQRECRAVFEAAFGSRASATRSDVLRLELIRYLLDVMVHRCLIFRLQPAKVDNRDEAGAPAIRQLSPSPKRVANWRFTPHRFMQRAIFRKLHAPHVEHASVDQFGLSMWATQPDDLPRPNRLAAQQVADLLACWTGSPKDPQHIMNASAYHRALHAARNASNSDKDRPVRTLPARMLRASLGVVRTVYSVGVVSRFHDFAGSTNLEPPVEGFFEQHRLQVRWLIEQARKLSAPGEMGGIGEARSPFFAEEIVWLYNECGLFCLVQGRLDSAAGLFAIALRAAQEIEGGDRHSALWCRVNLNLAVADIERGRIREARKNLNAIVATEDENPILRLLVRGYLALVDHYSGNADAAERVFVEVIEDLDKYGQSRSVAIFSRHLAELYRIKGPEAGPKALASVDRSIAAATKGGHEDVRQMARLSRVRLAIDRLLPEEADYIPRRLDEIEKYGIDMGMPRLVADTAYARASHLLRLGETRHATQLACKCIGVATANQLRLRQMTAMALLGRICERRGLVHAARQLLARAFELAENCDYSNVRASVRRHHA